MSWILALLLILSCYGMIMAIPKYVKWISLGIVSTAQLNPLADDKQLKLGLVLELGVWTMFAHLTERITSAVCLTNDLAIGGNFIAQSLNTEGSYQICHGTGWIIFFAVLFLSRFGVQMLAKPTALLLTFCGRVRVGALGTISRLSLSTLMERYGLNS